MNISIFKDFSFFLFLDNGDMVDTLKKNMQEVFKAEFDAFKVDFNTQSNLAPDINL